GDDSIQQKQKENTEPKSPGGREDGPRPHAGGLLHGGNEQTPNRRCDHHAGGEAGQTSLDQRMWGLTQEKYTGSAQRCAEKRDENAPPCSKRHENIPPSIWVPPGRVERLVQFIQTGNGAVRFARRRAAGSSYTVYPFTVLFRVRRYKIVPL